VLPEAALIGSDIGHLTRSHVTGVTVTGSDVIFPALFKESRNVAIDRKFTKKYSKNEQLMNKT
jgi:hypothetical protein